MTPLMSVFYPQGVMRSICLETVVPPVVDAFKEGPPWFFDVAARLVLTLRVLGTISWRLSRAAANGKEAILYRAMIGTYNNKFGFHG